MEPNGSGQSEQPALKFRCKKVLPDAGKSSDVLKFEQQDNRTSLASATPEKTIQRPRTKSKERISSKSGGEVKDAPDTADDARPSVRSPSSNEGEVSSPLVTELSLTYGGELSMDKVTEIPEKYRSIVEFFDRMECSVRMLRLRKKLPTFRNISIQVEVMTKRKFLYGHLAQIKYVFPEALIFEKVRVHDKDSLCMVPDLKISFCLDVQQRLLLQNQSASMALRQAFRARLLNFDHAHPECSSIPEALLPEPFNRNGLVAVLHEELFAELSPELSQTTSVDTDSLLCASHFPPDFRKHFSTNLVPEKQNTGIGDEKHESVADMDYSVTALSSENIPAKLVPVSCGLVVETPALQTPKPLTVNSPCINSCLDKSTPAKCESAPCNLVVETPALQTPKLPIVKCPSGKSDLETEIKEKSSARKSLRFLPTNEDLAGDPKMDGDEITNSKEDQVTGQMVSENSKHQQILTALPNLFDMICVVFQSTKRSSMTKQELVHKILFYHCDIEETSEIEKQLQLLETLVPDWICGRTESSGDFLYSIQRSFDQETIRARIIEAL